jgi:hypothetical protein
MMVLTDATEEYDGATWTGGGALNTARTTLSGAGTQTAGLAFGGNVPPETAATEEYDGSSWTAGGSLIQQETIRRLWYSNSCISFWWYTTANTGATEEYNGATWTAGGSLNTARSLLGRCRYSNSSFRFWWLSCSWCYRSNRRI